MASQAAAARPDLYDRLKETVGPAGYRDGEDIEPKNYQDLMEDRAIRPPLLLRPASTEEVSAILALCNSAGQPVAPPGRNDWSRLRRRAAGERGLPEP